MQVNLDNSAVSTGQENVSALTPRRSNQSIIKEISSDYSLERLMLKLKLQYFGLMGRTDFLEKNP